MKLVWMSITKQWHISRNLKEGWLRLFSRFFWSAVLLVKAVCRSLFLIRRQACGDRVIYKGRQYTVSNWAGSQFINLSRDGEYLQYVPNAEVKTLFWCNLWHRFTFYLSWYATSHLDIDINRRIGFACTACLVLLTFSGCADLRAQAEPAHASEAKPIDSDRIFSQLQALRTIDEAQDSRLAAIEVSIDGIAQRLDHPATVSQPSTLNPQPASPVRPACITIAGTDYDLEPLLDKFDKPWTWPGLTETSLREHLEDHDVTGVDDLPMDDLVKLHAVLHDQEGREVRGERLEPAPAEPGQAVGINPLIETPPVRPSTLNPQPSTNCPGGQCPAPGTVRSTTRQWTWTVPVARTRARRR